MKLITLLFAAAVGFSGISANAALPSKIDVPVSINEAFIPGGFDADSDVYVIVSGLFSNSCYSWKTANVAHNKATLTHEVMATASVSQGMCLMVLVPFSKEVQLGKLGPGEHKIRFLNGDGTYMEKILVLE